MIETSCRIQDRRTASHQCEFEDRQIQFATSFELLIAFMTGERTFHQCEFEDATLT